MSVQQPNIYAVSFPYYKLKKVLASLVNSSFLFEVLNPLELGAQWKNIHFLSSEYEKQEDLDIVSECIEYYKPKKLFLNIFDDKVNIAKSDLSLATLDSDELVDLCKKLVEYKKIQPNLNLEDTEENLELLELIDYFNERGVNPNKLKPEKYQAILTVYSLLQHKKKANDLASLAFKMNENYTTVFLFLAVSKNQVSIFEDFLNDESIIFDIVDWSKKIIEQSSNNKLKPFQHIIRKFETPDQQNIDFSFVISIFCVLFFAFAFPDGLYGLITAAVTTYLLFFTRLKQCVKNVIFVLFTGSLVSILFGLVTNWWAGNFFHASFLKTTFPSTPEFLLSISNGTESFQIINFEFFSTPNKSLFLNQLIGNLNPFFFVFLLAMGLGLFSLLFVFLLKLLKSLKKGVVLEIVEHLNWFIFCVVTPVSIIGFVNNTAWRDATLLATICLVVGFFVFNKSKNITTKLITGLRKIYSFFEFLKSVVSFSSLAVIGLMCYIFAVAINMVAGIILGSNITIISFLTASLFFILAHSFNLIFILLLAYTNTLKLLYFEILPHLSNSDNRNFKPFLPEFKYTKIITILPE